jgi:uncharacterized protein DUF4911
VTPDVDVLCLRLPRREIAFVKFVFESYEGIAVTRTLDRDRAVLALLVAPDFADEARRIVAALAAETGCELVPRPPEWTDVLGSDDEAE